MTNPKNKSRIRMFIILGSVVLITTLLATSGKTWLGLYSVQPVLSQSSPKPEVPVLSSPRVNGYVTGGSSGYIPFRGIINQPPSGGKVRIYACYVETCVSEPGVTCGTGNSIVCRTSVPLGKQASRYENVAPIAIPYAWNGKSVNWTMRAFDKKGNGSAWATPKSVTYNWTRRPTVAPTPCGSAGGGTGCSPTGSGGGGIGGGNNEPYTFGWETQIDQRAVTEFQLPACALNKNISWFLNDPYNSSISPQCTLHTSNRRCVNCHRSSPTAGGYNIQNTATNNRKDDLCRRIPNFLANSSEPQNFKNFFQDWHNRRVRIRRFVGIFSNISPAIAHPKPHIHALSFAKTHAKFQHKQTYS